jgi:hypothetical protein
MEYVRKIFINNRWFAPIVSTMDTPVPDEYAIGISLLDAARNERGNAKIKGLGYSYIARTYYAHTTYYMLDKES